MRRAIVILPVLLLFSVALGEEILLAPVYPVPEYVSRLLSVAAGEVGYKEDRDGKTKYGVWAGDPYAQWCAEYLCWCVDQVDQQQGTQLLRTVYPYYSGTNTGRDWFLRAGRYIARTGSVPGWGSQWYKGESSKMPSGSYVPQPGDWVFFSIVPSGDTTHVAMVEFCTADEAGAVSVHVLEGNMPDCVQRTVYSLNDTRILGYGTVYDLADIVLTGGCRGTKVELLQERLCYLGFLAAQYVTGEYGPSTVQAVRSFQEATGKTPTGIANQHTQLTLSTMYHTAYWQDDAHFLVSDEAGGSSHE